MPPGPFERLAQLLGKLLHQDELRPFLRSIDPGYVGKLPESARTVEALFDRAAEILVKDDNVHAALTALRISKPRHAREITAVLALFPVEPGAAGSAPEPPPPAPEPPPSADPSPGSNDASSKSLGDYTLLGRLDAGGFHEVHYVHHRRFDSREALRVWRLAGPLDADATERLQAALNAIVRLKHPNIVKMYRADIGDGHVAVAMKFIDAPTLDAWSHKRSWREIVRVYLEVGRGLAAAHAADVVHRDFRPSNVLVAPGARAGDRPDAVIVGFGLEIDDRLGAAAHYYACPEQCEGPRRQPTARCDQYRFCVALYYALYGHHPFFSSSDVSNSTLPEHTRSGYAADADQASVVLSAIRLNELRPPPADSPVPPGLFVALKRGLARDPGERHASMEALLGQLERELRPRSLVVGTAGAAAAGVGLIYFLVGAQPDPVPGQCARLVQAQQQLWSDTDRAATRAAFGAGGRPFAAASFAAVDRELSAYSRRWAEIHALACADSYVSRRFGEDVYDRRAQCLESRRSALRETIGTFAREWDAVSRIDVALAALPPLGDCAAVEAEVCRGHADTLAAARADERAGRFEAAEKRAVAVWDQGKARGDLSLVAEATFLAGRALAELGRWPEAAAALREAHSAADKTGCDGLAVDVANRLTKTLALDPQWRTSTSDWSKLVSDRLDRLYPPGESLDVHRAALADLRRAELLNNRGLFLAFKSSKAADRTSALADHREALGLRGRVEPRPLAELSVSHRNLGAVLVMSDERNAGLDHFKKALELAEAAFGAGHPATWRAHFDLGKASRNLRREHEAATHLHRALELAELVFDRNHIKLGEAHFELAQHYDDVRQRTTMRKHAAEAGRIFAELSPDHPRRINGARMLGYNYMVTGEYPEALKRREELFEEAPEDTEELAISRIELAEVFVALERWDEAHDHAFAAVTLLDRRGADDPLRGEAMLYRGLALAGRGDRKADELLRGAQATLERNFDAGKIEAGPWIHATWEVTRRSCAAVPDRLREEVDREVAADDRVPALIRRISAEMRAYDPAECAGKTAGPAGK